MAAITSECRMATPCPQDNVDTAGTDQCPHGHGAQGRQADSGDSPGKAAGEPGLHTSGKRPRRQRPFDFSQHGRRHVAVRLAYLGWGYQGFASQANTDNTVEAKLFQALLQTRLVESRQTANYHRSGRTDKGVSAFGQVRLAWGWVSVVRWGSGRYTLRIFRSGLDKCVRNFRYWFKSKVDAFIS